MKRLILAVVALVPLALLAADPYIPTDAERARWTMSDMMSWRTAIDAYCTDFHHFPEAAALEQLRDAVQPRYIAHAPMVDGWGHPYRYQRVGDRNYRVVSAGADGAFDEATWSIPAKRLPFDADAVVTTEGRWMFRSWEFQ